VFTSSIATLGRVAGGVASEQDAFNWWDEAPHYIRSRVEAENRLLDACKKNSFPGIALCVANTYGPEDYQPTPQGGLLWQAATGKVGVALDCAAPTVDIRDAANAALLAEHFGTPGERYIVANRYISQPELYTLGAESLCKKPPRKLSLRTAYAMAAVNEFIARLFRRKDIKLCRDSIFLSEVFGPLDHAKATDELGWDPRPVEETVRDAIAWFSARTQAKAGIPAAHADRG
jgi:dihydroflavonol-4-reductase